MGVTRAALWVALRGGRSVGRALTWVGTGWFLMAAAPARAASRDYLGRVLGRPARLSDVARHFHGFACAVLDRVLLLAGHETGFDVQVEGLEHLMAARALGRGCILMGAHLGSFEVLRFVARQSPVPVWALMYRRNGGALTWLLDRLAPGVRDRVLEIGDTDSMIRVRECVERGELVGILADRVPEALAGRMVRVPFLGGVAAFPSGPFVLAGMLGAPVVLFHAVRTGERHYVVRFQPFRERVVLSRERRAGDLRDVVCAFAATLEAACRVHPFQWFNFFPFWVDKEAGADDADRAARAGETGGLGVAAEGGGG